MITTTSHVKDKGFVEMTMFGIVFHLRAEFQKITIIFIFLKSSVQVFHTVSNVLLSTILNDSALSVDGKLGLVLGGRMALKYS